MNPKILAFTALLIAPLAQAQDAPPADDFPKIHFDRSDTDVPLNITYDGQDILIYGAIENNEGYDPDLIISVTGPNKSYEVHKKTHELGVWINSESMTFRGVPSFLALFSDAPIDTIMLPTEKIRYKIGFERSVPIRGISQNITDPEAFAEAFIRLQQRKHTYVLDEDGVKVSGNILFSARIPLAANVVEGTFKVRIYLLRKGRVVAQVESDLPVYKSGLERWLFDLAENNGWAYGLLAIFLAVAVALLMSQVMRLFQR